MFHIYMNQGLRPFIRLLVLAFLSTCMTAPSSGGGQVWDPWSFRDGSLVVSEQKDQIFFSFPYVPLLDSIPAWVPAFPRHYLQAQEPVLPWNGLGGILQIGFIEDSSGLVVLGKNSISSPERTPVSFSGRISRGQADGTLEWFINPDEKGVRFQYVNSGTSEVTLGLSLHPFMQAQIWAIPGKKERHDYGIQQLRWADSQQAFLSVCGSPIDATCSPVSALWVGDSTSTGMNRAAIQSSTGSAGQLLKIKVPPQGAIRFGFLHADNASQMEAALKQVRSQPLTPVQVDQLWKNWFQDCCQKIQETIGAKLENIPGGEKKLLENNLIQTRQLFLSNGGLLSEPITPERFNLSLPHQTVALKHWRALGLEIPSPERWGELIRYNRMHNRSIDIPLLKEGGLPKILQQGRILMASPDPLQPPTKDEFDTLLGYVIAGGHLTLVDGFSGFEQHDGWWKKEGAADLADYAIRKLNVPVDPASRKVLDGGSQAAGCSPYLDGSSELAVAAEPTERRTVSITTPQAGGYLLISPAKVSPMSRMSLYGVAIRSSNLIPFHAEENNYLVESNGSQPIQNFMGEIPGAGLTGSAYRIYRLPQDGTSTCSVDVEGSWRISWADQVPEKDWILRKKAFQTWYKSELLEVPVSRLCHPVVYSGTYTCRVFDITGTEQSPILFYKVGLGTFMWIGLPREAILLGSDTGSDAQNSLRQDPAYDLVRMSLAFHDPKRAGAERASQPPLSGWGTHWSWGTEGDPNPVWAWFAWWPIEQLGWGHDMMSSWVREDFLASMDYGRSEGLELPHHSLFTTPDRQRVELATQAFLFAFNRGMARVAGQTSQTWLLDNSKRQSQMIQADVTSVLPATGTAPVFARRIEGLTAGEEDSPKELFPDLAWAVSEIPTRDFPGGEDWKNRCLSALVDHPAVLADPASSAAIATCCPAGKRGKLLESVLPKSGEGMQLIGSPGKSFDVSAAVPALHALLLKSAGK